LLSLADTHAHTHTDNSKKLERRLSSDSYIAFEIIGKRGHERGGQGKRINMKLYI